VRASLRLVKRAGRSSGAPIPADGPLCWSSRPGPAVEAGLRRGWLGLPLLWGAHATARGGRRRAGPPPASSPACSAPGAPPGPHQRATTGGFTHARRRGRRAELRSATRMRGGPAGVRARIAARKACGEGARGCGIHDGLAPTRSPHLSPEAPGIDTAAPEIGLTPSKAARLTNVNLPASVTTSPLPSSAGSRAAPEASGLFGEGAEAGTARAQPASAQTTRTACNVLDRINAAGRPSPRDRSRLTGHG
jgi:hypothetical protein